MSGKVVRMKNVVSLIVLLIFFCCRADAEVPSPANPNCTSSESCHKLAMGSLKNIVQNIARIMEIPNEQRFSDEKIGTVCFNLGGIVSEYFLLKTVNINMFSIEDADKQRFFNKLFQIGDISHPSLNYCNVQSHNSKDVEHLASLMTSLKTDADEAMSLLK